MKHLKKFESFGNGLTGDQSDDITEIFFELCQKKNFEYKEALEYFTPGTDTFTQFLNSLEEETTWFDYTQTDDILVEISNLLNEMDLIERGELEGDIVDEEEDFEIEIGDYVDFGQSYGKLYVVSIHGDGYLVSDDKDQRWLGDSGDGFILPFSKVKDFKIIEKGVEPEDDDDEIFY